MTQESSDSLVRRHALTDGFMFHHLVAEAEGFYLGADKDPEHNAVYVIM
jgi:hypothetical protein